MQRGCFQTRGARCEEMSPSQDWPSVWPAAASFNPSVVPLPIRMGFVKGEKLVPDKWLNLELVKIPNFLHLTPEHIRRHCAAIKSQFVFVHFSVKQNKRPVNPKNTT